MSFSLQRLLPLFDAERAREHPLVLATVLRTAGPTYSKPGALMLITGSGEYAGLLSGGCLEGDLAEHGRSVLATGLPRLVRYDMRGPDDLLFGLGSGCEGAMDILLQPLDAANDWQPMTRLAAAWRSQRASALLLVAESTDPALPAGAGVFADDCQCFGAGENQRLRTLASRLRSVLPSSSRVVPAVLPGVDVLALLQPAPSHVLLLGAGPDAQPVAQLAAFLGWRLTVVDHRSCYAQPARFPQAAAVLDAGPAGVAALLLPGAAPFAAAVVMSHHLATDLAYLRALASSDIAYIGLLGPAVRRERLLNDLGADAVRLRPRLRAPIGLDLGAVTPEAIALSIAAEVHATLAGSASMAPLSRRHA